MIRQKKTLTSKNIKIFREAAGLTQERLAVDVGISRNYLALLEAGQRDPSLHTLQRISEVLTVPVSILTIEIDSAMKDPLDKLLLKTYEIASEAVRENRRAG